MAALLTFREMSVDELKIGDVIRVKSTSGRDPDEDLTVLGIARGLERDDVIVLGRDERIVPIWSWFVREVRP